MQKDFKILLFYPNEPLLGIAPTHLAILSACLKQYGFIAKKGTINKAPGKWILYSMSQDTGIFEIDRNEQRLGDINYNNANTYYKRTILGNDKIGESYLFIFTGLAKSNDNNLYEKNNLNFIEILLFGLPEITTNTIQSISN
jgi:hypothetical protein